MDRVVHFTIVHIVHLKIIGAFGTPLHLRRIGGTWSVGGGLGSDFTLFWWTSVDSIAYTIEPKIRQAPLKYVLLRLVFPMLPHQTWDSLGHRFLRNRIITAGNENRGSSKQRQVRPKILVKFCRHLKTSCLDINSMASRISNLDCWTPDCD